MKPIYKIFFIIISIIYLYLFIVTSTKRNAIEVSNKNFEIEVAKPRPIIKHKQSNYMFFDWDTTYNNLISKYLAIPEDYIELVKTKDLKDNPLQKIILAVNYKMSDEYKDYLDLNIFLYDSLSNSIISLYKVPSKFESDAIKLGDVSFEDKLDNLNDSIITFGINYYFESESNVFVIYEKYLEIYKLEKNGFSELLRDEKIYSSNNSEDESRCPIQTTFELDYIRLKKSKEVFYDFKISIKETITKFEEILDEEGYPDCKEISHSNNTINKTYKYSNGFYKFTKK